MTEKQLRKKLVDTAISYLGCKESNGSHKKIIDLYNKHKPLARGYTVKYTDAWCSTFASAMAIACGLTDIIPTECGCENHIELFKKLGSWQENDAHVPSPGDYVFYDWQDSGKGDNKGRADHVGIVVSVNGSDIVIIEGNFNNSVSYRSLKVNGRYIRGYGVPKYASKATSEESSPAVPNVKVGDVVVFTGTKHYTSSTGNNGAPCKPGRATVTALAKSGKHPVHIVAVSGGGSNVHGWVDSAEVARDSAHLAVGTKVRVKEGAKTYTDGRLAPFVYRDTYDVLQVAVDRVVIGKSGHVTAAVHKDDIIIV